MSTPNTPTPAETTPTPAVSPSVQAAITKPAKPKASKVKPVSAQAIFGLAKSPNELIADSLTKSSESFKKKFGSVLEIEPQKKKTDPEPKKVMVKDAEGNLVEKKDTETPETTPKAEESKVETTQPKETPKAEETPKAKEETTTPKTEEKKEVTPEAKKDESTVETPKAEEKKTETPKAEEKTEVKPEPKSLTDAELFKYADVSGDLSQIPEEKQAEFFSWRNGRDKELLAKYTDNIVSEAKALGQEITEEEIDTIVGGGQEAIATMHKILGKTAGVAVTLAARSLIPQITKQFGLLAGAMQPLVAERAAVEQAVANYEFFNSYPALAGNLELPEGRGTISFAEAARAAANELKNDPSLKVSNKKEYFELVAKKTVDTLAKYGIKVDLTAPVKKEEAKAPDVTPAPVVTPVQPTPQPAVQPAKPVPKVQPPGYTPTTTSMGTAKKSTSRANDASWLLG